MEILLPTPHPCPSAGIMHVNHDTQPILDSAVSSILPLPYPKLFSVTSIQRHDQWWQHKCQPQDNHSLNLIPNCFLWKTSTFFLPTPLHPNEAVLALHRDLWGQAPCPSTLCCLHPPVNQLSMIVKFPGLFATYSLHMLSSSAALAKFSNTISSHLIADWIT